MAARSFSESTSGLPDLWRWDSMRRSTTRMSGIFWSSTRIVSSARSYLPVIALW